jgi:predicted TIM-barrel fold metal-dependent hydrolase
VTTSSIAQWVKITREIVASEDGGNQRKFFYDNAARIYRIGPGK